MRSRASSAKGWRFPVAGRVAPLLDVRSENKIKDAMNLIKKGPITLVFIYADWCGHCSTFKPKYLNAVNSPRRTTQALMVNDAVVPSFNSALSESLRAKPLEVEGYPTTVVLKPDGTVAGEIPPSASEEDISVMATMGTPPSLRNTPRNNRLSIPTNNTTIPISNNLAPRSSASIETTFKPSSVEELGEIGATYVGTRGTNSSNTSIQPSSKSGNMNNSLSVNAIKPVSPSIANPDLIESQATPVRRGGGLYGALASAAYSLAPAGILLAGLHAVRGRKRTMKGGKRAKRSKRTRRNVRR